LEFGLRVELGTRIPRFLIGAWVPFKTLSKTPEVVVFYSPPTREHPRFPTDTHPFVGKYPYAVTPKKPNMPKPWAAKDVEQPYVGHVINYVLTGYKIIYQLLAAGRNPILIMPSQPSGHWGPLDSQPGLCRLIKEVVRFLYAKQLVSSRVGPFARVFLVGGRSSIFPPEGQFTDERVPNAFAVTVSGFSEGMHAVINVCTIDTLDKNLYPRELFHSAPADLLNNWGELWDIDGVIGTKDRPGYYPMVKTFRAWLNSRRTLRAYHSDASLSVQGYRASENGLVDPSRVVRKPSNPNNGVYAEEGHSPDKRITWVYSSNPSLEGDLDAPGHELTIPEFGRSDAHHMVPAIAFGHAGQFVPP
jgi:hypothetical protein